MTHPVTQRHLVSPHMRHGLVFDQRPRAPIALFVHFLLYVSYLVDHDGIEVACTRQICDDESAAIVSIQSMQRLMSTEERTMPC